MSFRGVTPLITPYFSSHPSQNFRASAATAIFLYTCILFGKLGEFYITVISKLFETKPLKLYIAQLYYLFDSESIIAFLKKFKKVTYPAEQCLMRIILSAHYLTFPKTWCQL